MFGPGVSSKRATTSKNSIQLSVTRTASHFHY
jgi:hypothetical protein